MTDAEYRDLVNKALDRAEAIWNAVGDELREGKVAAELENLSRSVPSAIPGHDMVDPLNPLVDKFIAIVVDMRNSTDHLLCAISPKTGAKVTELQRVFYETSALLPLLAAVIYQEGGRVTEYLGDGVLGFFLVDNSRRDSSVYAANRAGRNCIRKCASILNPIIRERYGLPALQLGVGMAYSKAAVTTIGLPGDMHAKVIGRCVYYATKLSNGTNEVWVDDALKAIHPTEEGSGYSFKVRRGRGGVAGHCLEKDE